MKSMEKIQLLALIWGKECLMKEEAQELEKFTRFSKDFESSSISAFKKFMEAPKA